MHSTAHTIGPITASSKRATRYSQPTDIDDRSKPDRRAARWLRLTSAAVFRDIDGAMRLVGPAIGWSGTAVKQLMPDLDAPACSVLSAASRPACHCNSGAAIPRSLNNSRRASQFLYSVRQARPKPSRYLARTPPAATSHTMSSKCCAHSHSRQAADTIASSWKSCAAELQKLRSRLGEPIKPAHPHA